MHFCYYGTESAAVWWNDSYTIPAAKHSVSLTDDHPLERIQKMASANAVVIFSISTCCMCHAVKRLFSGMGVSPTVHEIDQDPTRQADLETALLRLLGGGSSPVPAVFIGGKLVGSMDSVMASHISGTLVPLLKQAGALWL
ncbi:hypothetical protein ABFS82_06G003700 [Erythranthe guttata]|uniref:Glutaredoxin domain-containing protein n=1 Tax=Erythranthe guttata TaxID=4155 RepID=A0A022QVA7_ERYGU|nr:PREDICTED: glutaredoxin-C1-like [Erythranthe guttata]EYU31846.1 hypothetical protein MIMGU_mgv1a026975mg [Erythranthe guttata]|eukprot:XP_012844087.1 PREDICTED: glutaredoxin-C1-like [Erythranthe guttata]